MEKLEIFLHLMLCIFSISMGKSAEGIESVSIHIPVLPCSGLVFSDVLLHHANVVACSGSWTGHIGKAEPKICNDGWHVCSRKDYDVMKKITWFEATRMSGCYAINAAHDGTNCGECAEGGSNGEMAAIGANCLVSHPSSKSCFGRGKIDASSKLASNFTTCHPAPWITGFLCCKDKERGHIPKILRYPKPYVDVISGANVTLNCVAEGDPAPSFHWLKNGKRIIVTSPKYSQVNGKLTITSATTADEGFYHCEVTNGLGSAISYKAMVRVKEERQSLVVGCRNPKLGTTINSEDVAFCKGKWKGHVKKASKQLCARGWRVCSVKNARTLHGIQWEDVTSKLPGCYAYNAASSTFFPCSSCMPKRKGNRMAGLGGGCAKQAFEGYSCLRKGRIDAKGEISLMPKRGNQTRQRNHITQRAMQSCSYDEDYISGVVCCKNYSSKTRTNVNARSQQCGCRNGGVCVRGNACKCKYGFAGNRCQRRLLGKRVPWKLGRRRTHP